MKNEENGSRQENKRLETILLNEDTKHKEVENYDENYNEDYNEDYGKREEREVFEDVTYIRYANGEDDILMSVPEERLFGKEDNIDMPDYNVDYEEQENNQRFQLANENNHNYENQNQNNDHFAHNNDHNSHQGLNCHQCEEWECEDILQNQPSNCGCHPVNAALTEVVESIAHQENGFAKILDSESKKICKAIGVARSVDDLVRVNKSVQNTIRQINNIQIVLLSKLQEVSEICDGCNDDCGCN